MASAKKLVKKIPDKQLSIGRQHRQNTRVLRQKVRSCEKRLDTFSAEKSAIEITMTAPGFYDQSNASDIALQVAEVESIDFQVKWVEEVCLQHQEELEQMNQSGA